MGYPKQPTEAQRKDALDGLVRTIRRDLSAACFVRDRAHQYVASSGSHDALMQVAIQLERGEHFEAFKVGELDDLIEQAMTRRSDRLRREAEAHAAEIRADEASIANVRAITGIDDAGAREALADAKRITAALVNASGPSSCATDVARAREVMTEAGLVALLADVRRETIEACAKEVERGLAGGTPTTEFVSGMRAAARRLRSTQFTSATPKEKP